MDGDPRGRKRRGEKSERQKIEEQRDSGWKCLWGI